MQQLEQYFQQILNDDIYRLIISKPKKKENEYKKIVIEKKNDYFQIAKYTEKQVFHENIKKDMLAARCTELTYNQFLQVNAWTTEWEYYILISKKGNAVLKRKRTQEDTTTSTSRKTHIKEYAPAQDSLDSTGHNRNNYTMKEHNRNNCGQNAYSRSNYAPSEHNRRKNYILEEGTPIPPLVDMGVFTKEGKVVRTMYDKFKQINRFIEMIDDTLKDSSVTELNVIDFGCGKSYLTFILYYYLTEIKKIKANMIGLDLKADVIKHCNEVAKKYGYDGLRFELGDINGYQTPFDVDIVITLHACDTATDFALYNAATWDARMIFSVPCCQHELNSQIQTDCFKALTDYGIIKERFAALATDAIRGKLLEYCGYKAQLLEFIDFAHTPKNILIRAVKRPMTAKNTRSKAMEEVEALCEEFHFKPTLYNLIKESETPK